MNGNYMVRIQRIKYTGNILSNPANTGGSVRQAALMGAKPANNLILNSLFEKFGFDHPCPIFI